MACASAEIVCGLGRGGLQNLCAGRQPEIGNWEACRQFAAEGSAETLQHLLLCQAVSERLC